jgi:hypothetical protein
MPIIYPFTLKIKSNTILHQTINGSCLMFSLDNSWMNEYVLNFLYIFANFVSNGTPSCLHRFVNIVYIFNKTFLFILSHIWVKYDNNVVLDRMQIFRIYFTLRLTLRGIPWTSHQMLQKFHFQYKQRATPPC